jgi:hypothetical protein
VVLKKKLCWWRITLQKEIEKGPRNVIFVTLKNWWYIFFYWMPICQIDLESSSLYVQLIYLHLQITKICLLIGYMELIKKTKSRIHLYVCALVYEIWNCRNEVGFNRAESFSFYRLFTTLCTGSKCGLIFSSRISGYIWSLEYLFDGWRTGYFQPMWIPTY